MTASDGSPGVVGLWQVGSLAQGAGDAWSDLDLVVVPIDQILSDVVTDPVQILGAGERVLFVFRRPVNGPAGGTYAGICFEVEHLPLWVDCYVWPLQTAQVPGDARVLVERRDHPIPRTADEFSALVDRHRAPSAGGGESDQDRQRFCLLATLVASKNLARGDQSGAARMLRWVDVPAIDVTQVTSVIAGLRHLLTTVTDPDLADAVQATANWVDMAEALAPSAP
ncbi:hypothetical protein SAMN04489712_110214 [Thermomonospora echinospora]|uniref:Nucleotidyltransferase domain-containing protein n=2 Tax=Thermomonospora echinospora TaxID=1992 RepID=A0A1H6CMR0_9ACTN|nr:hypothetical protein SAMN04489712_110214 [Thermomonospora echinospora]